MMVHDIILAVNNLALNTVFLLFIIAIYPSVSQITTTFPKDPVFTFSSTLRFPFENRDALGETQVHL